MIKDVKEVLARYGLNLNLDRCQVQTNSASKQPSRINVDEQSMPVVPPSGGFKVGYNADPDELDNGGSTASD